MTIIQAHSQSQIPLDPPAWTIEELSQFEAERHTDRHRLSLEEMRASINLEFENAFDWLLWSMPSVKRLDLSIQATLAVTALHWALPD